MRCLYNGIHPCGKCPACQANRQRAFTFRLDQERDNASFYLWLTLQYDDDHVPRYPDGEMCFSKQHCRGFFEKLRKRYSPNCTFKHFLVSEYGPNGTKRPHYHCLLFVYSTEQDLQKLYNQKVEMRDFVCDKAWPYGHVECKNFHDRVLRYITKYCMKPELIGDHHTMKTFTLISPGIGLDYINKIPQSKLDQMIRSLDFSVYYNGSKISLPRYYTDRILPHSKQQLRDAAVNEDWSEYDRLNSLRKKINDHHLELQMHSGRKEPESDREIRQRIGAAYDNFISKIKQRKDL